MLHLHTQFNRDLPWGKIDMDFMNLNQAAHGDREAGFMHTRLRLQPQGGRRPLVGSRKCRTAWPHGCGRRGPGTICRGRKFARFGDNMRYVAVTEGDKVAAEAKFGFSVNGYGVGDLVKYVNEVSDARSTSFAQNTKSDTRWPPNCEGRARHESLRDGARIELGMRLSGSGGFKGFTTTFEDLHGLKQLPGWPCSD